MAEFPLLPLPAPQTDQRPAVPRGSSGPRLPSRQRQGERLQPAFQRLQEVFDNRRDPATLRDDPTGIAPERALVFEVAGSVDEVAHAVDRIQGLEFLGDEEIEFEADDDFAVRDTRQGRQGETRGDRPVGGRLYLTMPDTTALRQLLRLWNQHQEDLAPAQGYAPWFKVFDQLRELRAWGPRDRISEDMVAYLNERLEQRADVVRVEAELWGHPNQARQQEARSRFREAVRESGGEIAHSASIPEIAYEAALIDVPISEARRLARREEIRLAICDDVMFIRPQSTVSFPIDDREAEAGDSVVPFADEEAPPVVAVLDGVPVLGHRLLDNRVVFDDPDDISAMSVVSERDHGTAMASLILHGDRNLDEPPLGRAIYFRPVLYAPGNSEDERPHPDRLLVDTIYRAILRIKIGEGDDAPQAPDVFIVNLSLGDRRRPFAGPMSPWGRLLDYLAERFGILFMVSAGNINESLSVPAFNGIRDLEAATTEKRQQAIFEALGNERSQRTLFSPAEALNVITVGAWHEDAVEDQHPSSVAYQPYIADGPNITSAMGLGHRKVVKPDIFMPGGKERVMMVSSGELRLKRAPAGRLYGLKTAVPDDTGKLDQEGLTAGTSVATALATRAAHRLFDALMDDDNGAILSGVDPTYYGVVVKALLVHRARWGDIGDSLEVIFGPKGQGKHVARRDNIASILGYGRPKVEEAMTCDPNRATLMGFGEVSADGSASRFRVPLPRSLDLVTEPRSITLTLAWFSPVNIRHRAYRRAKLEVKADSFKEKVGVKRARAQPSDKSVPRGSLFHVRYEGSNAVAFVDEGHLQFQVFCHAQGETLDQPIKYGLAVSVESGERVPVYQEIRQRLQVQPLVRDRSN